MNTVSTAMSTSASRSGFSIVSATRCHNRSSRNNTRTLVNKSGSKSITCLQHISERAQVRSDTERPSNIFKSGLAGVAALAWMSIQPLALSPALATDLNAEELQQFMPEFSRCISDRLNYPPARGTPFAWLSNRVWSNA